MKLITHDEIIQGQKEGKTPIETQLAADQKYHRERLKEIADFWGAILTEIVGNEGRLSPGSYTTGLDFIASLVKEAEECTHKTGDGLPAFGD